MIERNNRIAIMSGRVAFFELVGQTEDEYLFGSVFSVLRQKAKEYKEDLEMQARDLLKDSLINNLKDRGVHIDSVDVVLGKYRGSRFVTSAKIRVLSNSIGQAKELVKFLKTYHPGYDLKKFDEETKIAEYNIR
jgi:hypothetical protein